MPPKKLRKIESFQGAARPLQAIRSVKMVQPACMVMDEKYKVMNTGPCQRAVADDILLRASWFRECNHGPDPKDIEKAGYPGMRPPYFEVSYQETETEDTQLQEDGSLLVVPGPIRRTKVIKPRITQVALSRHVMSGEQLEFARLYGCLPLEDFGIAPFCQYWNCWRQELRGFKNGQFCGSLHAKLVKASEVGVGDTGFLVPIAFDDASKAFRDTWLASIDV